jgi:2-polyprenyl-3-methyl-5-hydroxy-6-metoxy-1,4-benzoquinol methylase
MLHEWLVHHRQVETTYWWFVNRRAIVQHLLDTHAPEKGALLEVGSGGGLLSAVLQQQGWNVTSADLHPAAASFAREQGVPKSLAFDADKPWPLQSNTADAFVMLDVLEHLEHPVDALNEAYRLLTPNGIGLITVPAYQFLFSAWDEYNHHYRRYTTTSLRNTIQQANFHIERLTYWNIMTLPPAIAVRLKDRFLSKKIDSAEFPKVPKLLNDTLIACGRLENQWLHHLPLPAGLTVLAVIRKPKANA